MKEDNTPIEGLPKSSGMTVPEGYFADFAARMSSSLPANDLERQLTDRSERKPATIWHRVRPYVYMAAMFAGVWCMLKMFTMLSSAPSSPLDQSPILADALGNDMFVNEYIIDDMNQWDIVDDLMEEGIDIDALADTAAILTAEPALQ